MRAGDKFGRWLQQQGYNTARINEALLESYVNGLERYCSGNRCKAAAGLMLFFQLLRQQRVVIERRASPTPMEQWLARYDRYLEQVVGAAVNTRDRYRCIVRRFIIASCGTQEPDWSSLTGPDHY